KQGLLPPFTACDVDPSPAADAYFTDILVTTQGLFAKSSRTNVTTTRSLFDTANLYIREVPGRCPDDARAFHSFW
ncbi:hypothetical protein, partial [Halomonas elongata]|uniref:hypothetical protein n=1 Tax=Halomonas elongata TaxID=2746 RepID=UPI0023B15EB5